VAPIFGAPLAIALTLVIPQGNPTGLDELVQLARDASPRVQAARLRAEAAHHRIEPAGSLPDPMLTFGLMNRSVSDPTSSDIQMTMNQVTLSQRLPWWGRRAGARAEMEALSAAEQAGADEVEAGVVGRVRELYYRIGYLEGATATLRETRELLRGFREVTESLYEVGDGLQADVLQAQVAVAQTTAEIEVMTEQRTASVARLNALLGRAPETPLGDVVLPPPGDALPSLEALMGRAAEARPALRAARERIRAAQAARETTALNRRPDISLMAGYSQRPEFDDLASLSIGFSLPVFAGAKQEPQQRETEARLRLREAEEVELLHETYARLTELRAAAERARTLEALYTSSILPQARAAVEAALSSYQVGQLDFMTLLNAQMMVNRYEIDRRRLAADHHMALAGIEAQLDGRLEETVR